MTATTEVVYVIGAPTSQVVKIGRSVNATKRLGQIQTMSPLRLSVRWTTPGGVELETTLHQRFKPLRLHGEWFDFGDEDAVVEVQAAVEEIEAGVLPLVRFEPEPPRFECIPVGDDEEEWINPTELARRVVEAGYAPTMTRQRIYQLADTDPAWPAPRSGWRMVGNYKLLPWDVVEPYFKARDSRSGPKGWAKPKDAAERADGQPS